MSAEASEDLNPVSGQEETPQSTAEQPGESESAGEEALDQLSEDGGTLEEGEAEEEEVIFDDSTHQLWGHGDAVHAVAVSPPLKAGDGNDVLWVASGGQDEKSLIHDETGNLIARLSEHTDTIIDLGFHVSGEYFASASMDSTVQVYRIHSAPEEKETHVEHLRTLDGPGAEIEWMCWHDKAPILAAGSADLSVWMWNAKSGQCMRVFSGHSAECLCGTFTADGKLLATGDAAATLFIWSPKTGKAVHTISGHRFHTQEITCIEAHPTQPLLITGSADGSVCITHVDSGQILHYLKGHKSSVESVDFCDVVPLAVSASVDGQARIWDTNQGACRSILDHGDDPVVRARFLPNSGLVVTAGVEGVLRLWDARNGKLIRQWAGPTEAVHAMDVFPDGKRVVLGSDDHCVRIFDLTKKPEVVELEDAASGGEDPASSQEEKEGEGEAEGQEDNRSADPEASEE